MKFLTRDKLDAAFTGLKKRFESRHLFTVNVNTVATLGAAAYVAAQPSSTSCGDEADFNANLLMAAILLAPAGKAFCKLSVDLMHYYVLSTLSGLGFFTAERQPLLMAQSSVASPGESGSGDQKVVGKDSLQLQEAPDQVQVASGSPWTTVKTMFPTAVFLAMLYFLAERVKCFSMDVDSSNHPNTLLPYSENPNIVGRSCIDFLYGVMEMLIFDGVLHLDAALLESKGSTMKAARILVGQLDYEVINPARTGYSVIRSYINPAPEGMQIPTAPTEQSTL